MCPQVENETAHIVQQKHEELRALKIKVTGQGVGLVLELRRARVRVNPPRLSSSLHATPPQMDEMAEDFSEMMTNTLARMTQEVKVAIQSECLPDVPIRQSVRDTTREMQGLPK